MQQDEKLNPFCTETMKTQITKGRGFKTAKKRRPLGPPINKMLKI
jgi:hypothetical protein